MGYDICQIGKGSPGLVCRFTRKQRTWLRCELGEIVLLCLWCEQDNDLFVIIVVMGKNKNIHSTCSKYLMLYNFVVYKVHLQMNAPQKIQQIIQTSFTSKMSIITFVWNRNRCTFQNSKDNAKSKKQTILEYLRNKCFRLYLFIQSKPQTAQLRGLYLGLLITLAMGNCQKNNSFFILLLHSGISDSSKLPNK